MALCEICEAPTSGYLEFCKKHYQEWKVAIKDKHPWVRVLKNDAQRERQRSMREHNNESLDAMLERAESGQVSDRRKSTAIDY